MNKRMRKKNRLGEYRELCFEITCAFRPGLAQEQAEDLVDTFLREGLEANGLVAGGSCGPQGMQMGICPAGKRTSATEAHRALIQQWLSIQPDISTFTVGSLRDAWYGWKT